MNYIITDTSELIIELFEAVGTDHEDEAEKRLNEADYNNNLIFNDMMLQLANCSVDVIEMINGVTLYTYTRSAQHSGLIQRTAWMIDSNGDYTPLSHTDITPGIIDKYSTDSYYPGAYNTITY